MEISNVMVRKINTGGNLKGFASLNYGGLIVRNIRILDTGRGMFLGMPQQLRKDTQEYEDVCFFIAPEAREAALQAVSAKYSES